MTWNIKWVAALESFPGAARRGIYRSLFRQGEISRTKEAPREIFDIYTPKNTRAHQAMGKNVISQKASFVRRPFEHHHDDFV